MNRAGRHGGRVGSASTFFQRIFRMIDTCQAILELEVKSGREALDGKSLMIFQVYRFLCDYENGGLSGYLYNLSPEWGDISELATIATTLKHPELADALTKVTEIARRGPSDYEGTWDGWLSQADPANELDKHDETISGRYNDLWDDLEILTTNK